MTSPSDVLSLLGRPGEFDPTIVAQVEQAISIAAAQVRSYTRNKGFSGDQPTPELDTVVLTTAARIVSNPENLTKESVGPFETERRIIDGWTLAEMAVLNRYRRRAA